MNTEDPLFSRFDQVRIITNKNVSYLSAPPGSNISPQGVWQVSAAIGMDLLLAKNSAIIRIPATDVLKVSSYDLKAVTENFGRLHEYGYKREDGKEED